MNKQETHNRAIGKMLSLLHGKQRELLNHKVLLDGIVDEQTIIDGLEVVQKDIEVYEYIIDKLID